MRRKPCTLGCGQGGGCVISKEGRRGSVERRHVASPRENRSVKWMMFEINVVQSFFDFEQMAMSCNVHVSRSVESMIRRIR